MKPIVALCLVSILTSCARFSAPQAPLTEAASKPAGQARSTVEGKAATEARLRRIEATEGARAAATRAALAREKVAYLLSVLPEQVDRSCSGVPALEACQVDARAITAKFEQALAQSDVTFDEHQALSLYQASREKVAEGKALEFDCLLAKLDKLGGSEESRRDLDETLKSLEIREKLVVEAGLEESLPCLDRGVEQYQTLIVQDHQLFSRQPVLATQSQLHRDFRGQFEAQIACLQSSVELRPTAANY